MRCSFRHFSSYEMFITWIPPFEMCFWHFLQMRCLFLKKWSSEMSKISRKNIWDALNRKHTIWDVANSETEHMRCSYPSKDQMRCSRHVHATNEMLSHENNTNEMFHTGDDNKWDVWSDKWDVQRLASHLWDVDSCKRHKWDVLAWWW